MILHYIYNIFLEVKSKWNTSLSSLKDVFHLLFK